MHRRTASRRHLSAEGKFGRAATRSARTPLQHGGGKRGEAPGCRLCAAVPPVKNQGPCPAARPTPPGTGDEALMSHRNKVTDGFYGPLPSLATQKGGKTNRRVCHVPPVSCVCVPAVAGPGLPGGRGKRRG